MLIGSVIASAQFTGGNMQRREFVGRLAALGATGLLSGSGLSAQGPAEGRRIIDVHQHFVSPAFFAALGGGGGGPYRDYTPDKNIAETDKAGITTATASAEGT